MIKTKRYRSRKRIIGGTKKTRGQVNQDLNNCMEEKATLEKNLKDIKDVLISFQVQINTLEDKNKEQDKHLKEQDKHLKEQDKHLKEQDKNIESLERKDKDQDKKIKEQNIEIGNLQSNVIYENIFTTLQDINRYKGMEINSLIKDNGALYKLRNDRNKINHFIDDHDPITEKENKMKFIMDKLLIIKQKKPKLVNDFNNRYNGIISKFINYLKSINIEYDETTYEQNKPEYEAWWNHLP